MTALIIVLILAFAFDGWFFLKRNSSSNLPVGDEIDKQKNIYGKWYNKLHSDLMHTDFDVVCAIDSVKDLCDKYNAPFGVTSPNEAFTEDDINKNFQEARQKSIDAECKNCIDHPKKIVDKINELAAISEKITNKNYEQVIQRYSLRDLKRVWKIIYDREAAFDKVCAWLKSRYPSTPEEQLKQAAFNKVYEKLAVPKLQVDKDYYHPWVEIAGGKIELMFPYRYYMTLSERLISFDEGYGYFWNLVNILSNKEIHNMFGTYTSPQAIIRAEENREKNRKRREEQKARNKYKLK